MSTKDNKNIVRRETKQKALVLETVRNHFDHPTADSIYTDVRKIDGKVSKGTVYRNLNELTRLGLVNHIKVPGAGPDRFDLRTDFHYHIICTKCEKVEDVQLDYEKDKDEEAGKKTGFSVFRHRTVFEGICPECMEKEKESV